MATRKACEGRSRSSTTLSPLAEARRSTPSSATSLPASFRRRRPPSSRGSSHPPPNPHPAFRKLRETRRGTSASGPAVAAPSAPSSSSRYVALVEFGCHWMVPFSFLNFGRCYLWCFDKAKVFGER